MRAVWSWVLWQLGAWITYCIDILSQYIIMFYIQAMIDAALASGSGMVLLDVRPKQQYDLFHLPGSVNVPIEELTSRMGEVAAACSSCIDSRVATSGRQKDAEPIPIIVVCRRGNASQLAVQELRSSGLGHAMDIVGGITQWARDVDGAIPIL